MTTPKFKGWFSDVGFTCRVLIICDMLREYAATWGAHKDSTFVQAILEIEDTALLEMDRWEDVGKASGFFAPDHVDPSTTLVDSNTRGTVE